MVVTHNRQRRVMPRIRSSMMVWGICTNSRRNNDLSLEMVWGGSGSNCKRLFILSHTYSMGLKSDDYDRQSTGVCSDSKQCFRYKILTDNASPVNSGIIVHKNRTRIRSCKKWANILQSQYHQGNRGNQRGQ